jgi:protein SMG9
MFMLSISDVVLVVSEGADVDYDTIRCLKRADMLKHGLPEFPLISPEKLGISRPDIHSQPQVGKSFWY